MKSLALLFMFLAASPSFAGFVLVAKLDRTSAFGTGPGGEFRVTLGRVASGGATSTIVTNVFGSNPAVNATTGVYNFKTFCVEIQETVSLNTWFKVGGEFFNQTTGAFTGFGDMSDRAFYGDGAPPINQVGTDQLDNQTKNLFTQWSQGAAPFGTKTNTLANQVQDAIWMKEDEKVFTGAYQTSLSNLLTNAGNAANSAVRVMNLFQYNAGGGSSFDSKIINFSTTDESTWQSDLKSNRAQDQIFYDPSLATTPAVPEPATAGLLGLGMLVAGAYRARRKSKA